MSQAIAERQDQAAPARLERGPVIGAVVVAGLMLWVFSDFFIRQVEWAIEEQADWGHTLVIPFIAGYFVYLRRRELLARPFRTTWIGFVPIALGITIYLLGTIGPQVLAHHNVQGVGVGLTLAGVVLLFCGFRAMIWLWFPLAYLFIFGQTISYRLLELVTFRLQDVTARGSYLLMVVLGFDIDREGNTLNLFHNGEIRPLNIAEACSGMRMLMAFLALGVAMAFTGLKRFWQRALVVAMGVPTAIFVNILRVVSLALLSVVDADFAAGDFHSFVGLVWLVPAFLIYLGVIWIVRHLMVERTA
ncbi:MAG: exosortase/archaeosortase family protein [Planctomycetes bacterium]|nr:exosortase/archaeosortase family protein [Planctomycetota bacterium]